MSNTHRGISLGIISTLLFVTQDAITKHLASQMPIALIIACRYSAFLLFVLWYCSRSSGLSQIIQVLKVKSVGVQIFRSGLLLLEIAVFALTLRYIGIGEMHAVFASYPLMVSVFSVFILGEYVGWRRWLAVVIGFIGTVIIVNPSTDVINPALLLALCPPVMFALYNVITRYVSRTDSFDSSLFYTALVGFCMAMPLVPFYWQGIDDTLWGWLLLLCVISITSHLLLIKALELTAAVILQPFNYLSLVWASLIGYFVYSEIMQTHTWVGAAIVVATGIYVAMREYRLSRRTT